MLKKSTKGFTLIEILIVVAIIGILASVVVVGLGPAQKRGRDARRASDLRSVQTALELYYGKNTKYPNAAITDWKSLADILLAADLGVSQIPSDPTTNKEYLYATDVNGTTYILGATLDDPSNALLNTAPPAFTAAYTVKTGSFANCAKPIYCLGL
jgi:prepilin-type N-terminal cleavage/methylation domain-containing protein